MFDVFRNLPLYATDQLKMQSIQAINELTCLKPAKEPSKPLKGLKDWRKTKGSDKRLMEKNRSQRAGTAKGANTSSPNPLQIWPWTENHHLILILIWCWTSSPHPLQTESIANLMLNRKECLCIQSYWISSPLDIYSTFELWIYAWIRSAARLPNKQSIGGCILYSAIFTTFIIFFRKYHWHVPNMIHERCCNL